MKIGARMVKGFTLVEIVIAIGLFSFAIIGIVFLLGTGLESAKETQIDSSLSSALAASAASLRTGTAPSTSYTNFFDLQGSRLTNASGAYYALKVTPLNSSGELSTNICLYSIVAVAPYPSTNSVGKFLVSRPR